MSSVRRTDANIVHDDSLYAASPPQVRFQSAFTPEEGERIIKAPTQSMAQEVFEVQAARNTEEARHRLKERQTTWLFGDSKLQARIDKSELIN